MYTSLNHLSMDEIIKIKNRYYQGDSVYRLLGEYNLSIAPSQFYKHLPAEQIEDYGCSKCRVNLVRDAAPRSNQKQIADPTQYYCPICGRKPYIDNHGWLSYPLLSDDEIAEKQSQIKSYYERKLKPIAFDSLPLTAKIYLAALCCVRLDKDQQTILPIFGSQIVLASTHNIRKNLYSRLIKSGAITVNSESQLDAFDLDARSFPRKYDKEKVSYKLNLISPDSSKSILETLKKADFPYDIEGNEILELWQEIAIGECITYLQYRLDKIGFPFSPGEKTHLVFKQLLKNFSVSQIYYIIWCKVNDASRWYLEGGVSKQHAANSVIGACLHYGENAAIYERELPQYRRPADCPRSILTLFFYNKILNLGPEADNICPCSYNKFLKSSAVRRKHQSCVHISQNC